MTAPARVTQADMTRAVNAASKVAGKTGARVIIDLSHGKVEIVIGAAAKTEAEEPNPWE